MRRILLGGLMGILLVSAVPLFGAAVEEGGVGRDVVNRNLSGQGTSFPSDVGKLYAFTRVSDLAGGTITHRWIYGTTVILDVRLSIGATPWRTWSSKTILPDQKGEWKVEVLDDSTGVVLMTFPFVIE